VTRSRAGKSREPTPKEQTPPPPASQQRILAAAVEAFAETGYAGTTTSEIARRAGVAEGTIFRYYPTKKDLLIGAVGPFLANTMTPAARARLDALLTAEYPSVEVFVRTVAEDRLAFARENPVLVRLVVQEIPFHAELREQFRQRVLTLFFPLLVRAIVRLQERGLIGPIAPASAARLIMSSVIGYALPRLFLAPDAEWDDATELAAIAGVLARGLAPATSR
jgi:AcrR family transcriptional regulator